MWTRGLREGLQCTACLCSMWPIWHLELAFVPPRVYNWARVDEGSHSSHILRSLDCSTGKHSFQPEDTTLLLCRQTTAA